MTKITFIEKTLHNGQKIIDPHYKKIALNIMSILIKKTTHQTT